MTMMIAMNIPLLLLLTTTFCQVQGFTPASTRHANKNLGESPEGLHLYLDGKNGPSFVKPPVKTVDTTQLGNLRVPTVGIGTISWSSDKMLDLENLELQKLVDTAISENAAFFDTAERYGSHLKTMMGLGYGETENLLQKFIHRSTVPKSEIDPVVATKFTPLPWRTTAESVVEACQESCRRLGVDQLDHYQLHMPDIVQPFRVFGQQQNKDEIYWEGMAECYKRGLVKNIGVSNYGPSLLAKCQDKLAQYDVPLASNQIGYSLIGRHNGAQKTVDYCNENGIQVLAFYPFAMGLLTGKYNSISSKSMAKDTLTTLTSSQKSALELKDLKKYALGDADNSHAGMAPLLTVMEEIAQVRQKTVAQVALNYIICKGVVPIPGARSSAQVMDNIGAMGWRLTDQEVDLLETTADSLGFGFDGAGFKRTSEKFVGYGVEKWSLD